MAPPAGPPPGSGSNAKLWIGIGVGCLLLGILGCVGGWFYCKMKAEEAVEGMGAELTRISLTFTLSGVKLSCTSDPSGAGTNNYFHPQVAGQYGAAACQVSDQTIDAFGRSCTTGQRPCSDALSAVGSADESRVTGLGLDATQCYVYTSGTAKIVGCALDTGFKLVHVEGLSGVQ